MRRPSKFPNYPIWSTTRPRASEEIPDPPEPIVNGIIDLGRLATDALFLGIDPYPRKPDAVFEPPVEADDPEDHPFAALKALQIDAKAAGSEEARQALSDASNRGDVALRTRIPAELDTGLHRQSGLTH